MCNPEYILKQKFWFLVTTLILLLNIFLNLISIFELIARIQIHQANGKTECPRSP